MGFYGNITNVNSTTFNFDKIYPNRVDMDNKNAEGDGVFIGRYVLIDYNEGNPLEDYTRVYKFGNRFYMTDKYNNDNLALYTREPYYIDEFVSKPVVDENGEPVLDENGEPVFEEEIISKVNPLVNNPDYPEYQNRLFHGQLVFTLTGKGNYQQITFYECVGQKISDTNPNIKWADLVVTEAPIDTDTYFYNYSKDRQKYGDIGRGYDSTVWQKVYQDEVEKYVMIAELNAVVPTFGLTIDPPALTPGIPHFDADSTNVYYKLHLQPNWGIQIAEADKDLSDEKVDKLVPQWNSELVRNDWVAKENYDGAIYYNKDGLNSDYRYEKIDEFNNDIIKLEPYTMSGQKYNNTHLEDEVRPATEHLDILGFTFNLPSLGNTVSQIWDIVYGTGELFEEEENYTRYRRNKNINWNNTTGLRLVEEKQDGSGFEYNTEKVETLAGCINSVHDLMGMIVTYEERKEFETEEEYKERTSIDNALINRIYYGPYDETRPEYKGYFIKERTFELTEEGIKEEKVEGIKEFSDRKYYYMDNSNYYLETTGYHSGNKYYPLDVIKDDEVELYKVDYEPNKYYYLQDNSYILATEEQPNNNNTYYNIEEGHEDIIIDNVSTVFFPATSQKYFDANFQTVLVDTELIGGIEHKIYTGLVYINSKGYYRPFTKPGFKSFNELQSIATDDQGNKLPVKLYWGKNYHVYEAPFINDEGEEEYGDYVDFNFEETSIERTWTMKEFETNKYYSYDEETLNYILLNSEDEIDITKIYQSFKTADKFFKIDLPFYEPELYYYQEGNNYILAREAKKQLDKIYYIINPINPTIDIFYEPNKYYYKNKYGEYVLDMNPIMTEGREYYYEGVELYVYEDINNIITPGSKWNSNISEIPEGIKLGRRKEKYIWKELTGFARTLNTIHGLILKLNNLIQFNDEITRDTTTLQGCINKINDIIRNFGKLTPGQLVIVDNYGRISSSPYTSSQDVKATRYNYDYTNSELTEESIEIEDNEEGWLGINTVADKDNLNVEFTHKYNPIDKEINEIDMNAVGDTFGIPVPVVDTAGHVVALDLINAKLPNGYKSISTGETSSIAENSKDNLIVSTDSWLSAKAENGELILNHEYPEKQENTTSSYDVNSNGDNIEIETVNLDEKGHVKNIDAKTITLPFGYKSFTDSVNTSIAQNTQDNFMFIGDSWIKPIISQGQVELTHIGPVSNDFTEVADVKPQFGETVNITDLHFDSKGHKFAESSHTITIPQGSLEAPIPNGSDIINQLVFEPTTGKLTIERTNISSLKLSGYEKSATGTIETGDTLGQALSKLQSQIEAESTARLNGLSDLDSNLTVEENYEIITGINQTDGKLISISTKNIGDLTLFGYVENGSETTYIGEEDTILQAFNKIEDRLESDEVIITTLQNNVKNISDNFDINVEDIVKSTEFEYVYNGNTSSMTIDGLMVYISALEARIAALENPIEETPEETPIV